MKYKVLCIAILLIIGKVEISIGGNKSKAESKKPYKNFILPKSFDTNISALPIGYKGDDIVKLYTYFNISEKRIPVKDEFESTDKYKSRLSEFKKQNSFVNNIFAVKIKHKANYDADKQVLNINLDDIDRVVFSKKLLSRYVGSNAFNVKRIVESYNIVEYGIFIPNNYLLDKNQTQKSENLSEITTEKILPNTDDNKNKNTTEGLLQSTEKIIEELLVKIDLQKKMEKEFDENLIIQITSPKEAKYLKQRIGTLLIFKPVNSGKLISYTKTFNAATIDSPEELIHNKYKINIYPLSLWIYDISNGKIIKKCEY